MTRTQIGWQAGQPGLNYRVVKARREGEAAPDIQVNSTGDYNAVDAGTGRLHAIWADGRNGDLDVFTEAILLPGS